MGNSINAFLSAGTWVRLAYSNPSWDPLSLKPGHPKRDMPLRNWTQKLKNAAKELCRAQGVIAAGWFCIPQERPWFMGLTGDFPDD